MDKKFKYLLMFKSDYCPYQSDIFDEYIYLGKISYEDRIIFNNSINTILEFNRIYRIYHLVTWWLSHKMMYKILIYVCQQLRSYFHHYIFILYDTSITKK
jgi:hypothetical protein